MIIIPRQDHDVYMKWILTIIFSFTTLFLSYGVQAKIKQQENDDKAIKDLVLPHGDFESMRKTGVAKVVDIISPLGVKLEDGRIIHLTGLDYPDLDYYDPGDYAVTAQKLLEDFLKNQKVIIYQTKTKEKGRINRMGHHIAHLVRANDQVWTQGLLLSLGVARVRTTKYNPEMAEQMLALEDKARKEKSGLWAIDKFSVLSPDNVKAKIGSYQIVEGVVRNITMYKNKIYLNFGFDWREDFTVSISAFNLRSFKEKDINPRKLKGKRIRVRGWIESYNGPYIDIDHAGRIEALFDHKKSLDQAKPNMAGTLKGSALPTSPAKPAHKSVKQNKNDGSALPRFND